MPTRVFATNAAPRAGRRTVRAAFVPTLLSCALALGGCVAGADDLLTVEGAGSTTPRLQNNEPVRRASNPRIDRLNSVGAVANAKSFSAFVGPQRIDYVPDTSLLNKDVSDLQAAGAKTFDPAAEVTVDFQGATLDFVLKQLLGGALGVNYIAPDNLGGKVDFRTEKPIPKLRVLDVVRDILGRNNLLIRYANGVYHVGSREVIEAMQENASAGARGEDDRRIVKLGKGNAAEVIAIASKMLPPSVGLVTTSSPNTVIVQANAAEAESTERLLRSLSQMATGEKTVAILPLAQSEPTAVAQKLSEFYAATVRGDETPVTVVPLEAQRAVLVGTPDRQLMASIRLLVEQLDRSVADVSSLRVIPLTHLRAEEIAPQLAQSFGGTAAPIAAAAPEPRRGIEQRASRSRLFPRFQQQAPDVDNEDGTSLQAPGPAGVFLPGAVAGPRPDAGTLNARGTRRGGEGAGGENDGGDAEFQQASARGGGGGQGAASPAAEEVRIIPDARNNSVLVYSSYRTYARMVEVVKALDVPQSQVVIEATVLEVELNDELSSGVAFFLQSNGFAVGSGSPGTIGAQSGGIIGFAGSVGNFTVQAVLRALQDVTGVKVVSSPYLTVVNGQPARLVIGDQIPFATASQSSNNLGNVTVTREVEILDTGVVMEITPDIHADNSVDLKINQSVSSPVASTTGDDLTPTISTRDIQSQVLVQSGRTILLGGMIQDRLASQTSKVPGLGDTPVIGNLFKQKAKQARRTELVVLITPRVSRETNEIEAITRQIQSSLVGNSGIQQASMVVKP
ncbi:secretin N-terminal domain-containing protein [Aureimonas leprariae]|nr:secretin N-terminal domain-containing protein [Aureimonas leprariae]